MYQLKNARSSETHVEQPSHSHDNSSSKGCGARRRKQGKNPKIHHRQNIEAPRRRASATLPKFGDAYECMFGKEGLVFGVKSRLARLLLDAVGVDVLYTHRQYDDD